MIKKLILIATVIVTWDVVETVVKPCNQVKDEWTGKVKVAGLCKETVTTSMKKVFDDEDSTKADDDADEFILSAPPDPTPFPSPFEHLNDSVGTTKVTNIKKENTK